MNACFYKTGMARDSSKPFLPFSAEVSPIPLSLSLSLDLVICLAKECSKSDPLELLEVGQKTLTFFPGLL